MLAHRNWIEGDEVRSLDVAESGPPQALRETVSGEFGPQLPKLATDLASGVPDLDGVEPALWCASLGGDAVALTLLLKSAWRGAAVADVRELRQADAPASGWEEEGLAHPVRPGGGEVPP